MRWRIPFLLTLVAFVSVSCDQQPLGAPDSAITFKVERQTDTFVLDYDSSPPLECPEEWVQQHGTLLAVQEMTTTPSGNVILRWSLDYDEFPPMTYEGLSTGRIYTLYKAVYSGGLTARGWPVPGMQHESLTEWYADDAGNELKVHWKIHFLVDEEWNFKISRVEPDCKHL
jgi:hypothetical protein